MALCPSREQLEHLLADRQSSAEGRAVEAHVEACLACQQALEQITAAAACLARPSDGQDSLTEPPRNGSEEFLRRLQQFPPTGALSISEESGDVRETLIVKGAGEIAVPPARLIIPGYELLGELGRGGMGIVYKARQLKANRLIALKMILGSRHASLQDKVRFQIEVEAVARLQHGNIVQLYEAGEHDEVPFFSLELCDGGSLDRKLGSRPLPAREAAALAEKLARAMHYAHARGIVHRDLKPANVLLTAEGEPKITDFGLAKRTDGGGNVSLSGTIMGTPSYMAPEQAAGKTQDVGPAADVYALGAILYELLTGRPPFKEASAVLTIQRVLAVEAAAPSRLQPGTPRDLDVICLKCLRKDPRGRYLSAEALADDLHRFLSGEPITARPAGAMERAYKWARRRPAAAGLLGASSALVAVVFVSLALVSSQLGATRAALRREEDAKQERVKAEKGRALARINALRDAAPGAVPGILADLEAAPDDVVPRLRELWDNGDPQSRFRVALALLRVDPGAVRDDLATWLLRAADPAEVLLARDALLPHCDDLRDRFWNKAEDATAQPSERFRALVALAAFDPRNERWEKQAPAAVEQMLGANPLHLGDWMKALWPVRGKLVGPLGAAFRSAKPADVRAVAATILADYAADRADVLADLLLEADARQYALLYPLLAEHSRAPTVERMRREVKGEGFWADPPFDAAWKEPHAEWDHEIEAADGFIGQRFALCQTLPLERWQAVAEGLRASGFRPLRLRPFVVGGRARVAAVWARDGRDWRDSTGLSAAAVTQHDDALRLGGFTPTDVAGYGRADNVHYAALWVKSDRGAEAARLYVNVSAGDHQAHVAPYQNDGYIPRAVQGLPGLGAQSHFSGVWWKARDAAPQGEIFLNETENAYAGRMLLAEKLLVDVDLGVTGTAPFASVWHSDGSREAAELHGLSVRTHLERCRELAAQGYRPVALSVASNTDGQLRAASVWHRPRLQQDQRERLARRQATAGVTLLNLGVPDEVWPLFRHRPDPEVRSQLIHRTGLFALDARQIVVRLQEEKDVSARRALILALGESTSEQLPADVRGPLVKELLTWYRDDPDPGIHAAIDWLLAHGQEGPEARRLDWRQAARLKRTDATLRRRGPDATRRWYVNGENQTMVVISGPVEFRMGSPAAEVDRREGERAHRCRIERNFAIGSKSVTVEEFQRFLQARPDVRHFYTRMQSPEPRGPIIAVTWFQAAQYCNWLSEKEGLPQSEWCYPKHADIKEGMMPNPDYLQRKGYRLPTEAEWEYAARAGSTASRYFGSSPDLLPRYAWFMRNAGDRTWPVGEKRPNDLGLFDTAGNVWNWVHDRRGPYPGQEGTAAILDKEDALAIDKSHERVLRGGSFWSQPGTVRLAYRNNLPPSTPHTGAGFRLARTLP
jgi:formylglycine-generating enzyme required for sulfatase activity